MQIVCLDFGKTQSPQCQDFERLALQIGLAAQQFEDFYHLFFVLISSGVARNLARAHL